MLKISPEKSQIYIIELFINNPRHYLSTNNGIILFDLSMANDEELYTSIHLLYVSNLPSRACTLSSAMLVLPVFSVPYTSIFE